MECKKYQKLILADYLDYELSPDLIASLEEHLLSCQKCSGFFEQAKRTAVEPLINARKDILEQDVIWARLKNKIEAERLCSDKAEYRMPLFDRLLRNLSFPKPAFALGTLSVLLVMLFIWQVGIKQSFFVQNPNETKTSILKKTPELNTSEQVQYAAFFFEQNGGLSDYGTVIEEYFL